MSKAKVRVEPQGYFEKHHILPKSLGGDDSEDNLVKLTAKEHIFAHKILIKITYGEDKRKMQNAFFFMFYSNNPKRDMNISDVAYAREQMSLAKRGKTAWNKGIPPKLSDEDRMLLREIGKKNLKNADNTNHVVARDVNTGDIVRVTKEEFKSRNDLAGINKGRKNKTNPERYGKMTEEEFSKWCEGRDNNVIKRATTYRNQYLSSEV